MELNANYGELQAEYDKYNKIESIDTVIVAYSENIPVGCGCYKKYDAATVEIKRMFVNKANRGKGISKMIIKELENWAKENNYKSAVLETGLKQKEAISLYQRSGYQIIDNYGQYIGNSNSICIRKELK
jgi:GNAT superfamily N-acetyltransferase